MSPHVFSQSRPSCLNVIVKVEAVGELHPVEFCIITVTVCATNMDDFDQWYFKRK